MKKSVTTQSSYIKSKVLNTAIYLLKKLTILSGCQNYRTGIRVTETKIGEKSMPAGNDKNNQTADPEQLSENKSVKRKKSRKNRGMYKVIFKGRLREGFSRETVIDNIVRLTKIPEQKIQQKFFSGKAVIIRRAHDLAHAQKLQQLFSQAGLEVIILKDETVKIAQQKLAEQQQTEKHSKKKYRKGAKTPLIVSVVAFVVLAISAAGYYFWNQFQSQMAVPETIVQIEQSLASEPLIFLAYANYQRLNTIKSYFIDDPQALPALEGDFFEQLKKSGINPDSSLTHILMAAYPVDNKLVTPVFLFGQFSVPNVRQFLRKYYKGKALNGSASRMRITLINPVNCRKKAYKEVFIEPGRIIVAPDGQLDNVLALVKNDNSVQTESNTDLSGWEGYRSDKLMAMALFKPQQGSQLATGLVSVISKDIARENTALDSIYSGLSVELLPPMADMDIRLNSRDQKWLNDSYREFIEQLKKMQLKSSGLASVQILLDKVSIEQNTGLLDIHLQLDKQLKDSLAVSVNDFIDTFFSMDIKPVDGKKNAVQEKIDTSPQKYNAQIDSNQLKPFNKQYDSFFNPVWQQGPFALTIEEILLDKEQIVLQLRGKGQNIPNSSNRQAWIRIFAVEDSQGNNVLANAGCNKDPAINDYFSSFGLARTAFVQNKPVQYTELELRKKVRLKKGVDFAAVKALKAEINLNLATRTEAVSFKKNNENKVLSRYGSRILFKPSADDVLSYSISGNEQRILSVRALNDKHQYLSGASRSSMTNLVGTGRSVTQNFHGKIDTIEVIYASETEHLVYPVNITQFPPYPTKDQWQYPIESIKLSSLESWNKLYQDYPPLELEQNSGWYGQLLADWHNGPFNLGLYSLKTSRHWGTSGRLLIKTPIIEELQHNLSALEVKLNYPEENPGNNIEKQVEGQTGQSNFFLLKAKGYYMNGEFVPDKNQPWMDTTIDFKLPWKDEQQPLKSIEGEIIVHLPLSKHSSSFTDLNIGAVWEDVGLKLKMVRLGNTVMGFEVSGSRDRLLNIVLLDKDNNRISTAAIDYGFTTQANRDSDNSHYKILLNYQGTPVKALLTVSEGQQLRHYPFKLNL